MKSKPTDGNRERENVTRHLNILLECMTLRIEHIYNIMERVCQNHYEILKIEYKSIFGIMSCIPNTF